MCFFMFTLFHYLLCFTKTVCREQWKNIWASKQPVAIKKRMPPYYKGDLRNYTTQCEVSLLEYYRSNTFLALPYAPLVWNDMQSAF